MADGGSAGAATLFNRAAKRAADGQRGSLKIESVYASELEIQIRRGSGPAHTFRSIIIDTYTREILDEEKEKTRSNRSILPYVPCYIVSRDFFVRRRRRRLATIERRTRGRD